MKIAFVCTEKLPVPPVAGGAVQLYISEILPYIKEQHEITVFCKRYPELSNNEVVDNVRYIRVPASSALRYLRNIQDQLDESFDLIHIFNRPKWVLDLSEKLPSVRFSLSLHNEMFSPDKIPPEKAIECINRVEFINTVSKFIADGIKQLYPMAESKLRVVYSGVDIKKFKTNWSDEGIRNKELLKKKLGIENKRVILHVTRLTPKKAPYSPFGHEESNGKFQRHCFSNNRKQVVRSKRRRRLYKTVQGLGRRIKRSGYFYRLYSPR